MADVLIVIPARMASTRLPGKPLLDLAGEPMIVHVLRRAQAAWLGEVVVATDSDVVAACVEKAGGRAVMTRADHVSGSDRIFEALDVADPQRRSAIIVNVQGDLPTLAPSDIAAAIGPPADPAADIATLAAALTPAGGGTHRPERGEARRHPGCSAAAARALFHPRGGACRRGAALSSLRPLCLSPRGARPFRVAAPFAARTARETRAAARARSGNAHRCDHRRQRAARRRHARGSRTGARNPRAGQTKFVAHMTLWPSSS